jgi:hypothetical protein
MIRRRRRHILLEIICNFHLLHYRYLVTWRCQGPVLSSALGRWEPIVEWVEGERLGEGRRLRAMGGGGGGRRVRRGPSRQVPDFALSLVRWCRVSPSGVLDGIGRKTPPATVNTNYEFKYQFNEPFEPGVFGQFFCYTTTDIIPIHADPNISANNGS